MRQHRAHVQERITDSTGFAIDLDHLRRNARAHIEEGPSPRPTGPTALA